VLSEGKGQELHALLESFEFLDLRSDLQGQGRETDIMQMDNDLLNRILLIFYVFLIFLVLI